MGLMVKICKMLTDILRREGNFSLQTTQTLGKEVSAMSSTGSAETTAVSLTSNFYMKNFYRFNRNAIKVSTRSDYSTTELSYEDTRALKRAIAKLDDFNFEDEDNLENVINSVKAFAETYNYTIDTNSSEDASTYRLTKQLKALSEKYSDELEDIGITFEDDGKMSITTNILENSTVDEFKKVFAKDTGYLDSMRGIAKRMHNESYNDVYAMMTGCGGRLSILL